MLKFDHNPSEKTVTCFFTGRLDTNATISISDELSDTLKRLIVSDDPSALPEGKIVFDMKGVNYIASSFIRICVSTAKQVNRGSFSIINCEPFLKKTFKIAGLDELLTIK